MYCVMTFPPSVWDVQQCDQDDGDEVPVSEELPGQTDAQPDREHDLQRRVCKGNVIGDFLTTISFYFIIALCEALSTLFMPSIFAQLHYCCQWIC